MTNTDLGRELRKIEDTLGKVDAHLRAKDEMNAALHLSEAVRATPLSASVGIALLTVGRLINEIDPTEA